MVQYSIEAYLVLGSSFYSTWRQSVEALTLLALDLRRKPLSELKSESPTPGAVPGAMWQAQNGFRGREKFAFRQNPS